MNWPSDSASASCGSPSPPSPPSPPLSRPSLSRHSSPLGLAIGTRISEHLRERAEQVAGIALILLGAYLLTDRLVH
jgi:hypothetical protein